MSDQIKWVRAEGVARHMTGVPYAMHLKATVAFAFYNGSKPKSTPYLVFAPYLTIPQAVKWIEKRIKNFTTHEDSRESFEDKVRRKAIAAHGVEFVKKLRAAVKDVDHGEMELETMFSPKSHTTTLTKEDTEKVRADPKRQILTLSAAGEFIQRSSDLLPVGVLFNNGRFLK